MKISKKVLVITSIIVAFGLFLSQYWIYIPGWIMQIKDPIAKNHPVVWQQGPSQADSDRNKPNVIMIVVDDLGYNDLSYHGGGLDGGSVKTPHINSLAEEGINFTQGYASNATCSPSRAAMLTGRYGTRFGFEFTPTPKAFARGIAFFNRDNGAIYYEEREKDVPPMEEMSIPESEITIAELLQENGYHTIMLGKWHLGDKSSRPEQSGFDESLGFMAGASLFLPEDDPNVVNSKQTFDPIDRFLWANMPFAVQYNGSQRFAPSKYMTDYLTDEAIVTIEANRHRPFFMYLAYNAPHTPLQALKSDYDALSHISDHTERVYAAMVVALDRGVGQIKQTLVDLGLDENTVIMFTSDNGGAHYVGLPDLNKPYRGWKASFFEGGIRVPMFIRWPNTIDAGASSNVPVNHVDMFTTIASFANAPIPTDRVIDGINLLDPQNENRTLFWRSGHYKTIIHDGWKLQVAERPNNKWLFHLAVDPTEQINLAETEPEKLTEMLVRLEEEEKDKVEPLWPSLVEMPVTIDHPLQKEKGKTKGEYVNWAN